jgi:hypothetical protein
MKDSSLDFFNDKSQLLPVQADSSANASADESADVVSVQANQTDSAHDRTAAEKRLRQFSCRANFLRVFQ